MLVSLRLQSSFRFDPLGNLNGGPQAHSRFELEPPAKISLDQHKLLGGYLGHSA